MSFKRLRFSLIALGVLATVIGCASLFRLVDPDEETRFLPYKAGSDLKFDHETHALDCEECHEGLPEDVEDPEEVEDYNDLMVTGKSKCFECHNRGEKCSYCHEQLSHDRKPSSHTVGFLRHHGKAGRDRTKERCDWCHGVGGQGIGAETCSSCHTRMMPLDHGGRWKNSMHGRQANHNRERCFECHQSVSCSRCHSQPPETHTTAFISGAHKTLASRKLRSCYVCHSYQETCAKCHN